MRDEAEKRIGHLYAKVRLPKDQGGGEATVIAWLWARTVKCPNPACGAQMPLVRSFASLVAGFAQVPALRFGVLSAIGTVIYATIVASIGYGVGTAWHSVAHDLAVAGYVIFVIAVLAIAAFIIYRVRELRRESRDEEPQQRPAGHRAPRG